jgi:hypothetical protein
MWSRPIKSPPVNDRSYWGWNERTVIVEYALQRSLGRNNNLAVDLSWRLNAFSPLPFNPAMDAQRIYGAHWVNLTDRHALQQPWTAPIRQHEVRSATSKKLSD